jgi:5-methyltetrahydropteroyltriglutamate--homocysteine methyltransferase
MDVPQREGGDVNRTTPPFRADHVGSLLRPPAVFRARDQHAAGEIDASDLRAVEDEAIAEVVAMQQSVGLQSATDGEYRRQSWHMDFIFQLGGMTERPPSEQAVEFHTADGRTIISAQGTFYVEERSPSGTRSSGTTSRR